MGLLRARRGLNDVELWNFRNSVEFMDFKELLLWIIVEDRNMDLIAIMAWIVIDQKRIDPL